MRRTSRTAAVLVLLGSLLGLVGATVGAAPASAAAGSGTLTAHGDELTFSGTAGKVNVDHACTGPTDATCFAYEVTVADEAELDVTAQLTTADPEADFDLYVYASGGTEAVASSGNPGGAEQVDLVLQQGTYTFLVQPYTTRAPSAYELLVTAAEVVANGTFDPPATGERTTTAFSGTAPSTSSTCSTGNASSACHLFRIDVPYTGARLELFDGASPPSVGEYVSTVYDGQHRELGANTFIDGDDRLTLNLPGAGVYYVMLSVTAAPPNDTYRIDVAIERVTGPGSTIDPQPGPQPADTGLFTKTVGFATKTGYRGVFSWQASAPVVGRVHFGLAPDALTMTADVPVPAPDTAGLVVVDGLDLRKIYYWQVEDLESGELSVVKSFASTNAYTDWNGSTYTIDLLVQLDSQSLPPGIDADQAIEEISQGMNVMAERVHDATDGHAVIGQVLVTDTIVDHAVNVPFQPTFVCAGNNLADVLITTSVPFDSHTFGGFAIEDPCTNFYVGRLGQLVIPWEDDLHFGYVSTHELAHYAFNAPDLYPPDAGTVDSGGCKNLAWDGSLMHNSGGWNGARWELTELDRNATITPCDHSDDPSYSWDAMRVRYINVPLMEDGPIEHMFDARSRGNEDGGRYRPYLLDREPTASSLTDFVPDDTANAECAADATSTAFDDPEGDVAVLLNGVPGGGGSAAQPALDITAGELHYDDGTDTLHASLQVAGDPDEVRGSNGNRYRMGMTIGGKPIQLYATRALTDFASTETDIRRFEAYPGTETFPPTGATPISGSFDSTTNTVRLEITGAQLATVEPTAPALGTVDAVVEGITAESGYDVYTGTAGGDDAAAPCSFTAMAAGPGTVVPELPKGALPLVAVLLSAGAVVVLRRRRPSDAG